MTRPILLALAASSLSLASPDDPAQADRDRLQGTWRCVAMERNGRPVAAEQYRDARLVVERDVYTMFQGEQVAARWRRTLDARTSPRSFVDTHLEGAFKGRTYLGIYELDGDTLRTCNGGRGQARPTSFETRPGSGLLRIEFRREGR